MIPRETPDLCIFHGDCFDGFTAAWIAKQKYPNIELYAADYNVEPPTSLVKDKNILMVDFCYDERNTPWLFKEAKHVTLLDHHKTAMERLQRLGFTGGGVFTGRRTAAFSGTSCPNGSFDIIIDLDRSGAGITWDTLYEGVRRPLLVDYIEDRDLFLFKLPRSREVHARIELEHFTLDAWDNLFEKMAHADVNSIVFNPSMMLSNFNDFADQGEVILRKQQRDIETALPLTKRSMVIGGHRVWVANAPRTLASDTCEVLARDMPFGATYFDSRQGRVFSLRSNRDEPLSADVSKIAGMYGGGGHVNAAGFMMPHGWEGDELPNRRQLA